MAETTKSASQGTSQTRLRFLEHADRLLTYVRNRRKRTEDFRSGEMGGANPSEVMKGKGLSRSLDTAFKEVSLARYAARLLATANAIGGAVLIILFGAALYASSRTDVVFRAVPTLEQAISDHLGKERKADYNRLALFTKSVLESLNQIDLEENSLREGVRPMVSPQIWQQKAAERQSLVSAFRSLHVVQNLTVKSVEGVVVNEQDHRVRCYVKGFLTLLVLTPPNSDRAEKNGDDGPTPKSRTLPYRAEFIADVSEANEVNPYEFYMISLTERNGKSALGWDRQQQKP